MQQKPSLMVESSDVAVLSIQQRFARGLREVAVPISKLEPGPPWDDLAPLGEMIGDATVVAFGEGLHCGAEPLQWRNRLLQYLVEQKGFTAIAIESGLVESRIVHDYVRGGAGEMSEVLRRGIGWTFDLLPQNVQLVQWLRERNGNPQCARQIDFYGFDVSGSPGNSNPHRGVDTALTEALLFVSRVDPQSAAPLYSRVENVLVNLCFDSSLTEDGPGYHRLSQEQRDILTAVIADLIIVFERNEARYTQACGAHDYEWGYRAAIGARQVDSWLRQIPLDWAPGDPAFRPPGERAGFVLTAEETRDRAQADNIEWIVKQQGAGGKVLVFAHRFHLSTTPVKRTFGNDADESCHQVAGTYLRRRFGGSLVTIGNLIGGGDVGCGDYRQSIERAPPQSLDGFMGHTEHERFLLDLRTLPAALEAWVNQERTQEMKVGTRRQTFTVSVGNAFDVIFYLRTVTPACLS